MPKKFAWWVVVGWVGVESEMLGFGLGQDKQFKSTIGLHHTQEDQKGQVVQCAVKAIPEIFKL
jgi:hypothetical protein